MIGDLGRHGIVSRKDARVTPKDGRDPSVAQGCAVTPKDGRAPNESEFAFRALLRCLGRLGAGLAGLDLG